MSLMMFIRARKAADAEKSVADSPATSMAVDWLVLIYPTYSATTSRVPLGRNSSMPLSRATGSSFSRPTKPLTQISTGKKVRMRK